MDVLEELYSVILGRKEQKIEGSYTCYLFEQGIDKILKKCGEECAETIIAAKNAEPESIVGEVSDLIYHLLVMLADRGVGIEPVRAELNIRLQKQKNLKVMKNIDRNT